jgi:multidrug efflux system membrane fusion protein
LPPVRAAIGKGAGLAVEAWDREKRSVLASGTLRILDNQIDVATGTVKAKAMFENRDNALFPNQFVNVRVRIDTLAGAIVVPVSAVQRGAEGPYAYVVDAALAVSMRPLKTGVLDGERQQVVDGLQPGERVVTDGVDRLREGDTVKIDDAPAAPRVAGAGAGQARRGSAPPSH